MSENSEDRELSVENAHEYAESLSEFYERQSRRYNKNTEEEH